MIFFLFLVDHSNSYSFQADVNFKLKYFGLTSSLPKSRRLQSVIDSRISRIWSRFSIWNVSWNISSAIRRILIGSKWSDSFSSSTHQLETEFWVLVFHFLKYGIFDSKTDFWFSINLSDNLRVSINRIIAQASSRIP